MLNNFGKYNVQLIEVNIFDNFDGLKLFMHK